MNKRIVVLSSSLFCLLSAFMPAAAGDQELLTLEIGIHADDSLVSSPVITLEPGTDGSVHQGLKTAAGEDVLLKMTFHTAHLDESGAEMMLDVDFGLLEGGDLREQDVGHLESHHVSLRWDEPFEFMFFTALDAPSIRLSITPSRANRNELLLRSKKTAD